MIETTREFANVAQQRGDAPLNVELHAAVFNTQARTTRGPRSAW